MQGRLFGRLVTKEEERRLVEECTRAGPLPGGVQKRGDKSRQTVAKIVRGNTTGDIRRHCEDRERKLMVSFLSCAEFQGRGGCEFHTCEHDRRSAFLRVTRGTP